jgi:hypothetical protein
MNSRILPRTGKFNVESNVKNPPKVIGESTTANPSDLEELINNFH